MRTRMMLLAAAVVSSLCSAAEVCDAKFARRALDRFVGAVPEHELPNFGLTASTLKQVAVGLPLRMGTLEPSALAKIDSTSTVESVVSFGSRWLYPVEVSGSAVAFVEVESRGGGCEAISFGLSSLATALSSAQSLAGKDALDVVFIPQALEFHAARRDTPKDLMLVLAPNAKNAARIANLESVAARVKPIVADAIGGAR